MERNRESSRGSRDDRPTRGDRDDSRSSSRGGRDEARGGREETRSARRGSRDDQDEGSRGSSRGGRAFKYEPRSEADTKKRSAQGANDFDKILKDGIKMWSPADGDNRIRILPPTWDGAKHFGLDLYVHYGVGPDRQSYLDLFKMKDEADPITEERERARADGDEDYAKELDSRKRVLIYLVDRNAPKDGVQAWAMPWTVDRDIIKVSIDKSNGEVLSIDHPEEGFDLEFEKTGKGMTTKYLAMAISRRSTPLGKDEWLDFAMDNPLPEQLQYFDYDHIAKVFGGGSGAPAKGRDHDRDDGRGRGRDDERGSSRDRDRDEAPKGRDRDDRPARGRDRDEAPAKDDTPTWDSVHAMTGEELEDLVEQEKLDINPSEAKDDEDLADWICEEMKLKKVEASSRRRTVAQSEPEDSSSDRLRKMREGRDR